MHAVNADTLESVLAHLPPEAGRWAKANGYEGSLGSVLIVPDSEGGVVRILFGEAAESAPHGAGGLPGALPAGTYRLEGFSEPHMACLAFALGSYTYRTYKSNKGADEAHPRLVVPAGFALSSARIELEAVALVRDLINTPANDFGPEELADAACRIAERFGAEFSVIVGEDLLERNFPMIHAVGKASTRALRLIDFSWGDLSNPRVTLVGKGVCFDTGGLDIKPPSSMLLMKKDMGGAANVLGLAFMIMASNLPVNLRVLIPAVENSISGNAFRPGDILPSRRGISVEIGNTDAEGRLVLADALALADEQSPDLIVDMATLTGAARIALGPEVMRFYTDSDAFAGALAEEAETVADPLWRMPLWKPYSKMPDSKVADINHISTGGFAGSITTALFLSRFVENAETWAHFDIFGWNPSTRPGHPEGGEAQAIRAFFAALKKRYTA
ncbi:leucyl aminopeptidase family protein [Breoghania sp.]|uniref:leucyl aminopeptidase family protein n=1 Tax=Breoghania sp. TaxID=2065378 RepID=UPI00260F6F75|nr:leucyl aminopeptidase family protein [Breoghania sp.]MDJ0931041.1 leucyl aminopeptidase family protein [Breoghania sp.]